MKVIEGHINMRQEDNLVYLKNITSLKKQYPQFSGFDSDNIVKYKEKNESEIATGIENVAGRDILYVTMKDKLYQLDSLYDSSYMLDTWFSNLLKNKLRYHAKIFFFGMGNGMYIHKILKSTPEDVTIFVYEPSWKIFEMAMNHFELSEIINSPRMNLYVGDSSDMLMEEAINAFIQYEDLNGYRIAKYPNYTRIFPKLTKKFINAIQIAHNRCEAEHQLLEQHGVAYYQNTFHNLKYLYYSKSIEGLYRKIPKHIPAIIVSSGPSLDKNIEELKNAKGHSIIIAADSAVKALLRHDIIPDVFISVDGMKNSAHFQDTRIQNIPLVCNLESSEYMMKTHHGIKFYTKSLDFYIQEKLEELGIELPTLRTGGSVAHDCFDLVHILECNPIILVGQDLAYTENRTHSQDTVRGEWNINVNGLDTIMVEGMDGRPILSSYEFQLYIQWFEQQIQKFPELRVIDATEGGAMIHGTEILTLSAAIKRECQREYALTDIFQDLDNLMNAFQIQELQEFVKKIPDQLKYALQMSKQINRDYEKMLTLIYQDKYHNREFKNLYEKITERTSELENIGAMEYVQSHIQKTTNEVLEKVYDIQKDERSELITACNMGNEYIKTVIKGIETVLPDITQRVGLEKSSQ